MKIFKVLLVAIFIFVLFPTNLFAATISTGLGNIDTDPGRLASQLLTFGIGLAGGTALILMIIAAYRIIMSRGNPEAIQNGRDSFTAAVIGLLVIIFAMVILQLIGRDVIGIPGFGYNLHLNAYAATLGGYSVSGPSLNPGLDSIGGIISAFLPAVFAIAGMVTLVFLVVGGFKYLTSQGDPKATASARSTITSAIIGLTIILGLFVILQILRGVLNIKVTSLVPAAYAQVDLGNSFKFGGQGVSSVFPSFGTLFTGILGLIIPIAGLVFLFMLLWGGIKYMLSRGDDKAKMSARSIITTAIIGLLIIVGSFLIISVVGGLTGVSILK